MRKLYRSCLAAMVTLASACGGGSDGEATAECLALAPCASARLVNARTLVDGFLVVLKNADNPSLTPLPSAPAVPPAGLNAFFDHATRDFGFDADLDGIGAAETLVRGKANGTCNGMVGQTVCVFDWTIGSGRVVGGGKFSLSVLSESPRRHKLTIVARDPPADPEPVLDTPEECSLRITLLGLYMQMYGEPLFYSPVQLGFEVTRGTDEMVGTFIGEAVSGTCNGEPFACTLNPDDFSMSSCAGSGG